MAHTSINDNIFKEGVTIRARVNPALELVVHKYYRRIYYCAVVGQPDHKHFAYFEHELIPPPSND